MFYNDNNRMFYDGDKLEKFVNLINFLIFQKKIRVPLESHHGTRIHLNKYNLDLTIVNSNWNHGNKGNGLNHIRIIFSDDNYYHILTEKGITEHKSGLFLNKEFRLGIESLFRGYDHKIQHGQNKIIIDIEPKVEFVAQTLMDDKTEVENKEYSITLRNFVETLRESFLISKILK